MNDTLITTLPLPVRANTVDNPADILGFAAQAARSGGAAVATLVEITGGAARALGSHLAIASDGRFCGYVSGGCVEAAVATEALQAIAEGHDRMVRLGDGSPFFDIALPCGGGIAVAIHVLRDADLLDEILDDLAHRRSVGLAYTPDLQRISRLEKAPSRPAWRNERFVSVYRPVTRIVISGQTAEAEAVSRLAQASGYDVQLIDPLRARAELSRVEIDALTAVALLHHDLDREEAMLSRALASPAFYIGALGSTRTHRHRVERLRSHGAPSESIDRIKAPIGMFGPTRDATSLAISVLADIAAARLETFA